MDNYISITGVTSEGILSLTLTNRSTTTQVNVSKCMLLLNTVNMAWTHKDVTITYIKLCYQVTDCDVGRLILILCLNILKLNYCLLKLISGKQSLVSNQNYDFTDLKKKEFCTEYDAKMYVSQSCRLFIAQLKSGVL